MKRITNSDINRLFPTSQSGMFRMKVQMDGQSVPPSDEVMLDFGYVPVTALERLAGDVAEALAAVRSNSNACACCGRSGECASTCDLAILRKRCVAMAMGKGR